MKLVKSLSAVVLGGLLLATSTFAATGGYTGAACNPNTSTDAGKILYNSFGVTNVSGTAASVTCPASLTASSNINSITATVYDRSTTSDVCCDMNVVNADGFISATAHRCSSGFGTASQTLTYIPPAMLATAVQVACTIPPQTSNGNSHVITYTVGQ